jgi:hypothetical protein
MKKHEHDDSRPIGPEVFGSLWPDGVPKGWPEETAEGLRLVIDIQVPPDIEDDEVVRRVTLLTTALDDYYRVCGYTGLELELAEVVIAAEVDAEVPA